MLMTVNALQLRETNRKLDLKSMLVLVPQTRTRSAGEGDIAERQRHVT